MDTNFEVPETWVAEDLVIVRRYGFLMLSDSVVGSPTNFNVLGNLTLKNILKSLKPSKSLPVDMNWRNRDSNL